MGIHGVFDVGRAVFELGLQRAHLAVHGVPLLDLPFALDAQLALHRLSYIWILRAVGMADKQPLIFAIVAELMEQLLGAGSAGVADIQLALSFQRV